MMAYNTLSRATIILPFLLLFTQVVLCQENTEWRMNEIQCVGSHNSYKQAIERPMMEMMLATNPESAGLDYAHLPLDEQLDLGLRGLELDVLYDPQGGKYTKPKGLELLTAQGLPTESYDTSDLIKPGFKVLHIPDIDFRSHCHTFQACLTSIKDWSSAHPNHLPIIITINPKNSGVGMPGFTEVIPFDTTVLSALDAEIIEALGEKLITPAMVMGNYNTLKEAIENKGWLTMENSRGKVLFVLDAGDDITGLYVDSLDFSRPMFADVDPSHPHAGFFIMNNPIKQEAEIAALVKKGFMVRTRADANTEEAHTKDYTRFEAAIRSGAQLISTDYYLKSLSPEGDFEIIFKDEKYSQCNPLFPSENCSLK